MMQEINVDFALKGGDSFNFVKNHHYHSDEVKKYLSRCRKLGRCW